MLKCVQQKAWTLSKASSTSKIHEDNAAHLKIKNKWNITFETDVFDKKFCIIYIKRCKTFNNILEREWQIWQ